MIEHGGDFESGLEELARFGGRIVSQSEKLYMVVGDVKEDQRTPDRFSGFAKPLEFAAKEARYQRRRGDNRNGGICGCKSFGYVSKDARQACNPKYLLVLRNSCTVIQIAAFSKDPAGKTPYK